MYRQISGNKYHAETSVYGGYIYHSRAEAAYAQSLDFRKKAGEIASWQRQVPIELMVNGTKVGTYYVDFLVHHKSGRFEYVEVKGMETALWRQKWKHFEAQMRGRGDVDLTVVKVGRGGGSRWTTKDVEDARVRVFGAKAS